MPQQQHKAAAQERFRRELTKSQMADLLSMISGENTDLVQFDEVAKRLKARQRIEMGTQMVRLDQIVGSVGRYRDFNREFLPRSGADKGRWTQIDAMMNSLEGLPPVELFKIGDVYFVRDGNHRVSVAQANGLSHIEAYVTEYKTSIPVSVSDFERDQWLIKAEHADFENQTKLNELRPDAVIELTEPGRYEILLRHIEVHRYLRNEELQRNNEESLGWYEAVASWYDNVYMPMIEAIRHYDVLDQFPERTETDVYLWIAHHREQISQRYGLAPLSPDVAVATFREVHSERLLERTVKSVRLGLHRAFGLTETPLGMTEEEYLEARKRHDAGEISLGEAEELSREHVVEQAPADDADETEAVDSPPQTPGFIPAPAES